MPRLSVRLEGSDHDLAFTPGPNLRDLLDDADLRVRTACLGHGACGRCRVRIKAPPTPTAAERLHLDEADLATGVRLACQVRPESDTDLEVLAPAPPSIWQSVAVGDGRVTREDRGEGVAVGEGDALPRPSAPQPPRPNRPVRYPIGVAVDLGTTNLRITLVDLRRGRRLAQLRGVNPQGRSGADVLSRLTVAGASPEAAQALSDQVVGAIGEALHELTERHGIDAGRVLAVAVVGNSAMLSLLANDRVHRLLDPAYWTDAMACALPDAGDWIDAWGIHSKAEVRLVQPLAGFVGSDLLADLIATQFLAGPAPALLIDFGTNSEVALWDGERLWASAAAGGPAFEVCGYSCAMPAESGAIHRVHSGADGGLAFEVVEGGLAQGICGSGMVDLVAVLRQDGRLRRSGRFSMGSTLELPGTGLHLTHGDIDGLQQAKAGIAAAFGVLCARSGVAPAAIARVCVAGEFGRHLDAVNAIAIGLLPPVPPERVELCADAALLGCCTLLLDAEAEAQLEAIRRQTRFINLALDEAFTNLFVDNLLLQPMSLG